MVTIDVQFQDYVRGVRSSGPAASVLAGRLAVSAPSDIKPDEAAALEAVQAAAETVREVLADRDRVGAARVRPLLLAYVNDFSAIYEALGARSRVSRQVSNVGPRAEALITSLFPDGTSFLQLPAHLAWAEGFRRLKRIHDEKLKKEIDELIGHEYLVGAQKSTEVLGQAIGAQDGARVIPSASGLQEALAVFGRAVGAYGRALAAHCDETDEASVHRFLSAVAPIDAHRAAMRGTPVADDEMGGDDPVQPSPAQPSAAPTSNGSTPAHTTSNGSTPAPAPVVSTSTNNGTPAPVTPHDGNGLDEVA